MPIYEYRCEECGHELEAIQKMTDPLLRDCPSCGKPGLRKLVSASAFRLKGGGWYETDFKKGGSKRNVHDSGKSESSSSSSSDSSSSSSGSSSSASSKPDSGRGTGASPASR